MVTKKKKDGKFFNLYMNKHLLERLDKYGEESGYTKTTIVEKALKSYLDIVAPEVGIQK